MDRAQLEALPGLVLHDLMRLPLDRVRGFVDRLAAAGRRARRGAGGDGSGAGAARRSVSTPRSPMLRTRSRPRLRYLCEVGIGYLTLDRQSRTLSGGEVQRINLTTALGTSLVNTLFVLDEPSIGLHPRDMDRIVAAMHRLRDAGNTLVVVEHDPAVMLAADRLIDMGPGPGERGRPHRLRRHARRGAAAPTRSTGAYLGGRKRSASGVRRLGRRVDAEADRRPARASTT